MTLLSAQKRQLIGKKVKKLRKKQLLPAVVYGSSRSPLAIALELTDFSKVYKDAGTSSLVDLSIDGDKPFKVLIHEPQTHYLTNQPIHVDLYAVKMTEKLETSIPLEFIGTSKAVEELEGNFISNKDEISVRCLPADLVSKIEVDISVLETFDDQIKVKDLSVPNGIEIMEDPDDVVALVSAPISEEELEAELAEDQTAEAVAVEELNKEKEAIAEPEETETENQTN